MPSILTCAIDRPGLADALAARGFGMSAVEGEAHAAVLALSFAACIAPRWFACPGRLVVLVTDEATAIDAIDRGAEDALILPAGDALIAARIARLVGRGTIAVGDMVIDTAARVVTRAGRAIPLLPREYALLLHFARRPGVTIGRAELRSAVWGLDFDPGTNVVEVHVSRLRAKLALAGPAMIATDKGQGYRLEAGPIAARDIAL